MEQACGLGDCHSFFSSGPRQPDGIDARLFGAADRLTSTFLSPIIQCYSVTFCLADVFKVRTWDGVPVSLSAKHSPTGKLTSTDISLVPKPKALADDSGFCWRALQAVKLATA